MNIAQLKGYYFEEIVNELMKKTNYINVQRGNLPGRGANHQIDSYGLYAFTVPFVYPIRLISEVKWYDRKIDLKVARSFVGLMKDISENYFVPVDKNGNRTFNINMLKNRYTDCGAIFSVTEFSRDAQGYAFAHGIYLLTFKLNSHLEAIIKRAERLLEKTDLKGYNRGRIKELFEEHLSNDNILGDLFDNIYAYIGILDGIYPIMLTSKGKLEFTIASDDDLSSEGFKMADTAEKIYREETTETVSFVFNYKNNEIQFSLPKAIGQSLIQAIETTYKGEPFSSIEVPITLHESNKRFSRIFKIKLSLPKYHYKLLSENIS